MRKAIIFMISVFIIFMITDCEYFRLLTEEELFDIAGVKDSFGLAIINPADGMTVAGTKTVVGTVTNNNISKIELYIDGFYITQDIESPYEFSWDTTGAGNGSHSIRLRAFDSLNMMEEKSISVTVNNNAGEVDIIAPTAGISFPANGSNIIGNTLLISNCTDASGISGVYIYIDDNYYGFLSSGTGRLWLNTGNYSNGSKTAMIRAFDTAGNMGTASITVTVSNVNNDKNYMQSVPNETFTIGWSGITSNTASVTVSIFYMAKYEMTQGLWNTVYTWAITKGYVFNRSSYGTSQPSYPIYTLNWYDAVRFCNALSEMNGLTPCYYTDTGFTTVYRTGDVDINNTMVNWSANGYRLPTEAEWECAARYIDGTIWRDGDKFSGSDNIDEVGWYLDKSDDAIVHPVGQKNSNQVGIYDMSGNKHELCWDWFTSTYSGGTNPLGTDTSSGYRVRRGGAGFNPLDALRVSYRQNTEPNLADGSYAFRVVRRP